MAAGRIARISARGSRVLASFLSVILSALVATGTAVAAQDVRAQGQARPVVVVELDGAIDEVSARFLSRAINDAANDGAGLIVIRLDTPGGLLSSTREMVADIFASRLPVVVYVAPEGAQAASAGTFVGASAGVLAMAPATNIGAAAVVGAQGEDPPETLGKKVTEDATAFIRSIAQQRDRPQDALAATVLEAKAYSAEEALELGMADLIASDLDELLATLDGRTIPTAEGDVTVVTGGAPVQEVRMNFVERVLSFLADPNVVFLLISLGSLALVVELWSPGLWIPGTLGVLSLILGFAGLGNLPFSWASVALFVIALGLFIAETQAPGIGFFGITGAIALVLAGLFLVGFFGPPELPGVSFRVNRWILIGVGSAVGLALLWFGREMRRSRRPTYVSPLARERLVGQLAEVTVPLTPAGEVRLAGETWSAELASGGFAEIGDRVRVVGVRDLCLVVEPPVAGLGDLEAEPSAEEPATVDRTERE